MAEADHRPEFPPQTPRDHQGELLLMELRHIRTEMKGLRKEMKLRDELRKQAIQEIADRLDYEMGIRERLAALEARIQRP